VVDDELIGIPPGELFDEDGELELNGIPNAGVEMPDGGTETRPDAGAETSPDAGADTRPDGADALESSDPSAGWPAWLLFAAGPLPPGEPIESGKGGNAPIDWPLSGMVDGSRP
jgi:hypothetical protein